MRLRTFGRRANRQLADRGGLLAAPSDEFESELQATGFEPVEVDDSPW
jgi:hypothetical protein